VHWATASVETQQKARAALGDTLGERAGFGTTTLSSVLGEALELRQLSDRLGRLLGGGNRWELGGTRRRSWGCTRRHLGPGSAEAGRAAPRQLGESWVRH
jgi:hypothetical protein